MSKPRSIGKRNAELLRNALEKYPLRYSTPNEIEADRKEQNKQNREHKKREKEQRRERSNATTEDGIRERDIELVSRPAPPRQEHCESGQGQ